MESRWQAEQCRLEHQPDKWTFNNPRHCTLCTIHYLAAQYLATNYLATQYLTTLYQATQYLATPYLARHYLGTQYLATQYLHELHCTLHAVCCTAHYAHCILNTLCSTNYLSYQTTPIETKLPCCINFLVSLN